MRDPILQLGAKPAAFEVETPAKLNREQILRAANLDELIPAESLEFLQHLYWNILQDILHTSTELSEIEAQLDPVDIKTWSWLQQRKTRLLRQFEDTAIQELIHLVDITFKNNPEAKKQWVERLEKFAQYSGRVAQMIPRIHSPTS